MSKDLQETSNASGEVDLGQLFKVIGNGFERLFNFSGNILFKLFLAFVWFIFFIKKNIVLIGIAAILGFALGFVKDNFSNSTYRSSIIVRQNYNAGENLYDLVIYYNSLIEQNDSILLSEELQLPMDLTNTILGIDIRPTVSENSKIKSYDSYLKELDSTLASVITYEDYLNNTKKQEFKTQQVAIKSSKSNNLSKVFDNIIQKINDSEYYKTLQKRDLAELENRKLAILESLKESDTLKETYKKVLENSMESQRNGSQTSITIEGADKQVETKEYLLFQNDLSLRRELVEIERQKQDRENIIEVVSNQMTNATLDNSFDILGKRWTAGNTRLFVLLFTFAAILGLACLEFLKFLGRFQNKL